MPGLIVQYVPVDGSNRKRVVNITLETYQETYQEKAASFQPPELNTLTIKDKELVAKKLLKTLTVTVSKLF